MNNVESLQMEAPDYRETFSLDRSPFENLGDPKFFYASTALIQRLDLLTHLTQFGESVILVTGPTGSGKTTLLDSFSAQANSRWQLCVLHGGTSQQLAEGLKAALGAAADTRLEDALTHWDATTDTSRLLVIVIDNAEQLDQTDCENLCKMLALPQGERIRLILFGTGEAQPLVKQALQKQGSPQSLQVLEVPRLSEEDTASYLMYRLAVAGYSGESPFTATEVRAMCKAADGRPAAVNVLAHQTLTEHSMRANSKRQYSLPSTAGNRRTLWITATAGVLVLVAYVAWQRFADTDTPEQQAPQLAQAPSWEEVPLTIPESIPPVPPASGAQPRASDETPVADSRAEEDTIPAVPEPLSEPKAEEIPAPGLAQAPSPAIVDAPASADQESARPHEPEAPVTPERAVAPAAKPDTDETSATAHKKEPTEPLAARPPTASASSDPDSYPHREPWLLQQSADRYSLQLLGSRSEQSINRFIAEHKLDVSKTAYYRGRYKEADWYVLMYGVYPSREVALQQAQTLPAAIRKERPWPRDMKSVHLAIREAGE
ncbi:MAG: AAA family ATPase [Thiogranum sp.]|nr:AAA family ATPase [Thiogranum sp.]